LQAVWDATATSRRIVADFVVTSSFADTSEGHGPSRKTMVENHVLPNAHDVFHCIVPHLRLRTGCDVR